MKKHHEEVRLKDEWYQEEVALGLKRKRGGGTKRKMDFELSYQDNYFSAMAQCFIHSPSFLQFRTFRDENYLQMMNSIVEANGFTTLIISHLKVHVNTEHNAFMNAAKISNGTLRRRPQELFISVCAWWSIFKKTSTSVKLLACNLLTNSLNTIVQ